MRNGRKWFCFMIVFSLAVTVFSSVGADRAAAQVNATASRAKAL